VNQLLTPRPAYAPSRYSVQLPDVLQEVTLVDHPVASRVGRCGASVLHNLPGDSHKLPDIRVDKNSGGCLGLIGMWDSTGRPRLGLIAERARTAAAGSPPCCWPGAFRALYEHGKSEVTAEVDGGNAPSQGFADACRRAAHRRHGRARHAVTIPVSCYTRP
jgi:hypothetical protein